MKLRICGLLAIAAFAAAPGQSRAHNLTTLVSFCALANCADGDLPSGRLIADAEGNLFGTTTDGGAHGLGTVFEIAKTDTGYASTPTILVSFCARANCADGAFPFGGLIADAEGNLFGTTEQGGAHGAGVFVHGDGTVFEIRKTRRGYASTPTILVNFCALPNCADGQFPQAGLIADADGNLFGTTFNGGKHGSGTVFEIRKTRRGYASAPTTLVSFCALANCADGAGPRASLIADAEGNLFGTTINGGASGEGIQNCDTVVINGSCAGTVFEIRKTRRGYASTPTTLVSFCALANCVDGSSSFAGLIADASGNLFGTTAGGGAHASGTVFEIAKTDTGYASTPTTLVSFCALANCADGAAPLAGLIADASGNLFGTTAGGGAHASGTVFEIAKTDTGYATIPTTLISFCSLTNCADGFDPTNDLMADAKGNLFSTTVGGGANGEGGTVFEVTDSGFVVSPERPVFTGTPGTANCFGKSVSALAKQHGGPNSAAAALGYPNVGGLNDAIMQFCDD
jgi:uncharacterized repeat protein (TIGR03803 family)